MPKKPPTNKRPPPKALKKPTQQPTPAPVPTAPARPTSHPPLRTPDIPYLDILGQPIDFAAFASRPATVDPNDPGFSAALSDWSASTLGKLNALPNFDPKQLNAIAEAAVGGAHSGGVMAPGSNGNGAGGTMSGLPIDLPASLAALFEAKLTLDREKAKLLRMQKELKAHREQMNGVGNGKGKEVALIEEEDCPCGRPHNHHEYPASTHSADFSDEYCCETDDDGCTSDCGCNCHEYHRDDCDCEQCMAELEEHEHHHHNHGHHHDHDHDHVHHHSHGHHGGAHISEIDVEIETPEAPSIHHQAPPDIAEQVRNATVQLKNATAEANRASLLAEAQQGQKANGHGRQGLIGPPSGKNLSQDPERLDELVRELFNWIKAVVWTIEQAAVVAGRRNWHDSSVH